MNTFSINNDVHQIIKSILENSSLDYNLTCTNEEVKDAVASLTLSYAENPENLQSYLSSYEKISPIGYLKAIERNTKILDSKVNHLVTQEEHDTYSVGVLEASISDHSSFEESVVNNSHDIFDELMPKLLAWVNEIICYDGYDLIGGLLSITKGSNKSLQRIKNLITKYSDRDLGTVIYECVDNFQVIKQEYAIRCGRDFLKDIYHLNLKEGKVVYCGRY